MGTDFTCPLVNQQSDQKISFSLLVNIQIEQGDSGLLHDWQLQETNTKALESERSNDLCKTQ